MLVTNEKGNFLMLQKAKKPGEKSTKVVNCECSFFLQLIQLDFCLLQSTRAMVGKDEMTYTMEVVGQPEIVCVQKFKRIK